MQANRAENDTTSDTKQPAPLLLAPNVYICIAQGHVVFSNFNNDEYSAEPLGGDTPDDLIKALEHRRDEFLAAGLLTTDTAHGRPIESTSVPEIEHHILGGDDQRIFGLRGKRAHGLRINPFELLDFFIASWLASRELQTNSILRIVTRVRKRKSSNLNYTVDTASVARLTAIFAVLRPWYARNYLCLYDSLALIEFFARRHIFPSWVFAVQIQPFGAHCWVQHNGLLLNESTEYAGQFTPIVSI